jgi:UPF0042 nucleotide-binding protein
MRLVIVTGVSGAGKSTALRALEDLDYYCADNLPLPLVPKFAELLAARNEVGRAALGIDARSADFLGDCGEIFAGIRAAGHEVDVVFLDAADDTLIRRFSETRRRHPRPAIDIRSALSAERAQVAPLRVEASEVIDTAQLTVHKLREIIQARYGRKTNELSVTMLSFGFKYGIPTEADIVLDVRFLPNPFFVPELSPQSGEDEPVRAWVMANADTQAFLEKAEALLSLTLRGFEKEGKTYATIAIGCTGGRHRSVSIARELATRLSPERPYTVRHRDLGRTV